MGIMSRRDDDS